MTSSKRGDAGYATGRLWVEALRIDTASKILGIRVNIWTSLLAPIVTGVVYVLRRRGREQVADDPSGTDEGVPSVQPS